MAMVSAERRLGDVVVEHPHLEVAAAQIKLGEVCRAVELVQKLLHDRNREHVPNGIGVQRPVVDAETPGTVLLAHQKDGGGERRGTWPDDALVEHLLTLAFDLILQQLGIAVWAYRHRCVVGGEVDPVIQMALRGQASRFGEQVAELLQKTFQEIHRGQRGQLG